MNDIFDNPLNRVAVKHGEMTIGQICSLNEKLEKKIAEAIRLLKEFAPKHPSICPCAACKRFAKAKHFIEDNNQ